MKTTLFAFLLALAQVATVSAHPTTSPTPTRSKRDMAAVYTSCTESNVVALTFDDGPYKWHEQVSKLLLKYGAKGTFFVNGNNWDCIYSDSIASKLLQSYQDGHQIASHTWDHPHLTQQSSDEIRDELTKIDAALQKIVGIKPAFLRPPYGEYNDNVRTIVAENGQNMVNWDFDSLDSEGASASQSEKDYDNLFASKPDSILALNHETYDSTVHKVLPYVLKTYADSGYKFVTVAECLGMDPYLSIEDPSPRDDTWTC